MPCLVCCAGDDSYTSLEDQCDHSLLLQNHPLGSQLVPFPRPLTGHTVWSPYSLVLFDLHLGISSICCSFVFIFDAVPSILMTQASFFSFQSDSRMIMWIFSSLISFPVCYFDLWEVFHDVDLHLLMANSNDCGCVWQLLTQFGWKGTSHLKFFSDKTVVLVWFSWVELIVQNDPFFLFTLWFHLAGAGAGCTCVTHQCLPSLMAGGDPR